MGADALQGNGITQKILYFFRDKKLTSKEEPLRRVRKSRIMLFLAIQVIAFGATFAITQTIGALLVSFFCGWHQYLSPFDIRSAAIGFPIIIMGLIPLRILLIPRLPFTTDELAILDGPTASPFVRSRCTLDHFPLTIFCADHGKCRWFFVIANLRTQSASYQCCIHMLEPNYYLTFDGLPFHVRNFRLLYTQFMTIS